MNMKKIILITMPMCGTDHPHLGIGYLTSYLLQHGYDVIQNDYNLDIRTIIDPQSRDAIFNQPRKWSRYEEYMRFVYPVIEPYLNRYADMLAQNDAGIIGLSMYYSNIYSTFKLAQKIKSKNPEKTVLLGGPEASEKYAAFDCVDYIIQGEGEETLLELLNAINSKREINHIKGIIYKKNGRIINTGARPFIEDLDKLPFPVFQNFSENKYNYECVPMLGSRGCINRCSFCTETKFWKSYRSRTADNLYNEIVFQQKAYGKYQSNGEPREFVFLDSLINADVTRLLRFSNLLIENNVIVPWVGKVTVSKNLTKETLAVMRKAGCKKLMFGVESGSPDVLKKMRKSFDISTADTVLKNTRESGIDVQIYILLGFPTESDEHFEETIAFVRKNKEFINEIVPGVGCQVEKESDLFIHSESYGINWSESEEMNSENWSSEFSTLSSRWQRVNQFVNFCNTEGVHVITASLEASVPQFIEKDESNACSQRVL